MYLSINQNSKNNWKKIIVVLKCISKKHPILKIGCNFGCKHCNFLIFNGLSGVGGIRTLVQTSNTQAFYMLILLLVFVVKQTANSQLYAYLLKFSFPNRSFSGLISAFSMPRNRTSQNRTFGRHLVSLLYFGKNANPTKLRIKQQEQTLRCQLNSVARD